MAQLQHDRGLCWPLLLAKQRIVEHDQMHARRLNIRQRRDRVLEFPFERALIVHLLVKLRANPVGLVEELEAEASALRASLRGSRQASLVELRSGHAKYAASGRNIKWNLRLGEGLANLPCIVRIKVGIKYAPVRAQSIPQQESGHAREQQSEDYSPPAL